MVNKKNQKKETGLSGLSSVAGEFFVAAELSKLGHIATLTAKNTKGVDILVGNLTATASATIQVKTMKMKTGYWMMNKKAENFHSDRHFYVMVNLSGTMSGHPEYYVIPSKIVSDFIIKAHRAWLRKRGSKKQKHNDNSIRKYYADDESYLNRWDLLGL